MMDKQRECLEECKKVMAFLIFAAARFADVLEVYEIRNLFMERYENFLECYVSKEFVQNLKLEPPTKEMQLQLMNT